MQTRFLNFKQFFHQLKIGYFIILMVFLFLMTIAYIVTGKHFLSLQLDIPFLIYLDILGGLSIFLISNYIKKRLHHKSKRVNKLALKLRLYQKCFMLNLLIIVGYGITNLFFYVLTHNILFLIFASYALLLVLFMNPNTDKIDYLLQLSDQEQAFIHDDKKLFD